MFSQGVINLESLGKRGYRVPPSGTIQVVRNKYRNALKSLHHGEQMAENKEQITTSDKKDRETSSGWTEDRHLQSRIIILNGYGDYTCKI